MPVIPLGEIFTAGIPAIFAQLASRGWTLDREHTVVRGFPVQWLETSGLTEEAVREAQPTEFDGERGRVFRAEHPVAIAACVGRLKDRARIEQILSQAELDRPLPGDILTRYCLNLTTP